MHRKILVAATAMTTLLVILGGVVCVTESARGCPDWPRCYGQLLPPMRIDAIIEYSHRFVAALTTPLILAAAIIGGRRSGVGRWVRRPPIVAIPLLVAVIIFGAMAVLRGLPRWAAAIDVGSALLVLALLVTASVAARRASPAEFADRWSFDDAAARWATAAAAGVFLVLVTGVLVAASGSSVRCLGCFVPSTDPDAAGLRGVAQLARLVLAAVTAAMVAGVVLRTWRPRRDPAVATAGTVGGALLLAVVVVSALVALRGATTALLVASVATVVSLWVSVVAIAALTAFRRPI
jgi:cytochrome c oxidase assembly protein subunit 15